MPFWLFAATKQISSYPPDISKCKFLGLAGDDAHHGQLSKNTMLKWLLNECDKSFGDAKHNPLAVLKSADGANYFECANLLLSMKQFEAAQLFLHCQPPMTTKAVHYFLQSRNFDAVAPLISTMALHVKFAKNMEALGRIAEALRSHQMAKNNLVVINQYLYHLNEVDSAIKLVREQPFVEGTKLIAAFTLDHFISELLGDVMSDFELYNTMRDMDDAIQSVYDLRFEDDMSILDRLSLRMLPNSAMHHALKIDGNANSYVY